MILIFIMISQIAGALAGVPRDDRPRRTDVGASVQSRVTVARGPCCQWRVRRGGTPSILHASTHLSLRAAFHVWSKGILSKGILSERLTKFQLCTVHTRGYSQSN